MNGIRFRLRCCQLDRSLHCYSRRPLWIHWNRRRWLVFGYPWAEVATANRIETKQILLTSIKRMTKKGCFWTGVFYIHWSCSSCDHRIAMDSRRPILRRWRADFRCDRISDWACSSTGTIRQPPMRWTIWSDRCDGRPDRWWGSRGRSGTMLGILDFASPTQLASPLHCHRWPKQKLKSNNSLCHNSCTRKHKASASTLAKSECLFSNAYNVLLYRMMGDAGDAVRAFFVLARYVQRVCGFIVVAADVEYIHRANSIAGQNLKQYDNKCIEEWRYLYEISLTLYLFVVDKRNRCHRAAVVVEKLLEHTSVRWEHI